MDGSATPIIETSSASRKRAPQRTMRAPHARRLSLSEPVASGWKGARAIGCSCRVAADPPPAGLLGGGRLLFDGNRTYLFDQNQTMTDTTHDQATAEAPDIADVDLVTVLQALSDPVRLDIVRQLA